MAERVVLHRSAEKAIAHEAPAVRLPTTADRNFGSPNLLYFAFVALFSLAGGILAFGFVAPGLVIPTSIIAVFIAMFFGAPSKWLSTPSEKPRYASGRARFRGERS